MSTSSGFIRGSRFVRDSVYRIIANGLVVAIQQLVVYPSFARYFSSEQFGIILTAYGIYYTLSTSLGNSLNNVRQVTATDYNSKQFKGDFLILLFASAVIGLFSMIIFLLFVPSGSLTVQLFLLISLVLSILNAYLVVHFFITMDFKGSLINAIFTSAGFIIGLLLTKSNGIWSLPLFLGSLFAIIHLLITTPLMYEPFRKTPFYLTTRNTYFAFSTTSVLANAIIYLDRFFLFPLLGSASVSVFTAASFIGKSAALVITPISTVLLSYISQDGFVMTKKRFFQISIGSFGIGSVALLFSIIFAIPITSLLYPTLLHEAVNILFIANLAAIIATIANLMNPLVLRFGSKSMLLTIQVLYAIIYMSLGVLLARARGLEGFCLATLFANLFRLFALAFVGFKGIVRYQIERTTHEN